jgi:hypothetical protein
MSTITLYKATNAAISADNALAVLRVTGGAEPIALVSTEAAFAVGTHAGVSASVRQAYEIEAWSGAVGMRWTATSSMAPYTGFAVLITADEAAVLPNDQGWVTAPGEGCETLESTYACWGAVTAVNANQVTVADDARRFDVVGDPSVLFRIAAVTVGDRLDVDAMSYVTYDEWGNAAVTEERITGFRINARGVA